MGKITIRDVAREAGVSISLVSLVMNAKRDAEGNLDCNVNKDTARRIAEVAKRLGYRPNKAAASLRSGRFYTIGMVTSDIANQFFADIARYIENIAHNYNYTVLFGSSDENAEKLDNIVDTFIGNGVEGLIVAPCSGSEEVLRKALDAGIPTVLLDRDIAGLDVGRVMLDNERAGRMGVEHLYENGYRRIEMISYTLGISSLSERERGYCEAMRRYGLEGYSQIHYTVYGHAQEDTVRIFEDADGKTNLALADVDGEVLVVSQFTLYARCKKGNRPSFTDAGAPDEANRLYEWFVERARRDVPRVETGRFGAYMDVSLVNDGPFTLWLDTASL